MNGEHIVKIIAYSMPPLVPATGFRQYDLHIDGMSFFDMDKIYQLGGGNKNHSVNRVVSALSSHASQQTRDHRIYGLTTTNHQRCSSNSLGGHSTSTIDSVPPTIQQDFLDNYPAIHNNCTEPAMHDAFAPVTPEPVRFQQVSNQAIMNANNNNNNNKNNAVETTNNITAVCLFNDVPNMSNSTTSMTTCTNYGIAQFYSSNAVASCGPTQYGGGVPEAHRMPSRDLGMNHSTQYMAFLKPNDNQARLSLPPQTTMPPTSTFRPVVQWNGSVSTNTTTQSNQTHLAVTPGLMSSYPVNQSSFSLYNAMNSNNFHY
jgi:hypothetical protein